MAVLDTLSGDRATLAVIFGSLAILVSIFQYLFSQPPLPEKAPKLLGPAYPVIGALQFFSRRWDFTQEAQRMSHSGNFSFYAGRYQIVSVNGRDLTARKAFFESRGLGFAEGYGALLGGSPSVEDNPLAESAGDELSFGAYFSKRLAALIKGPRMKANLPVILSDIREGMDALVAKPVHTTNPFESIFELVFRLTMRTVACNEIADDPEMVVKTLGLFESVEKTATPFTVMYPWMPLPAKIQRMYSGFKLFTIFKNIMAKRTANKEEHDDPLQYLMDQGDTVSQIIQFVLGALFAGQLNSGINAAWILVHLGQNPEWLEKIRVEIEGIADKYSSADKTQPLKERLMEVPFEAWETEFPVIDLCLRESIRLHLAGNAFRKNVSGQDIPLNKEGTETIPKGAYATMAMGDMHYNPDFYENEGVWDPSRYLGERAEDKKETYAWAGWGVARHPCLGMRFAKLENNLIVAFFVAYFSEIQISDAKGNVTNKLPRTDRNTHTAAKPLDEVFLKYNVI